MKKYGFIGLGSQGAPIAQCMINAGLPTVLWARRPASLLPFKESSSEEASTIEELAQLSDYVGVCVVDNNDVIEVCHKLAPNMKSGAYIAIHSTVHPDVCREMARSAARHSVRVVDAPVSGGAPAAVKGELTVMVGGTPDDFAVLTPIFKTFGKLIIHLGDVGAGQHAKLINNAMLAANIAIGHYGFEAAETLGLDRDAFCDLVRHSSGHRFGFDVSARMSAPATFEHGARMLDKDVRLLGEALGESQAFSVINSAATSFLKQALNDT